MRLLLYDHERFFKLLYFYLYWFTNCGPRSPRSQKRSQATREEHYLMTDLQIHRNS